MYSSPNYTVGEGYGIYPDNDFRCESRVAYDGSVRNVGHPSDISIPTISLFESTRLEGTMTQYTSNVGNYSGTFSSFVITPPGEATFYTKANYEGRSICRRASFPYPSHWTYDISDLLLLPGQIKSMKFGCDSTNIHYSSPILAVDL